MENKFYGTDEKGGRLGGKTHRTVWGWEGGQMERRGSGRITCDGTDLNVGGRMRTKEGGQT